MGFGTDFGFATAATLIGFISGLAIDFETAVLVPEGFLSTVAVEGVGFEFLDFASPFFGDFPVTVATTEFFDLATAGRVAFNAGRFADCFSLEADFALVLVAWCGLPLTTLAETDFALDTEPLALVAVVFPFATLELTALADALAEFDFFAKGFTLAPLLCRRFAVVFFFAALATAFTNFFMPFSSLPFGYCHPPQPTPNNI